MEYHGTVSLFSGETKDKLLMGGLTLFGMSLLIPGVIAILVDEFYLQTGYIIFSALFIVGSINFILNHSLGKVRVKDNIEIFFPLACNYKIPMKDVKGVIAGKRKMAIVLKRKKSIGKLRNLLFSPYGIFFFALRRNKIWIFTIRSDQLAKEIERKLT